MRSHEVILEFQLIGRIVKVMAVDPATLTEVSIQAPAHLSEAAMTRAAIAKLDYVLKKKAGHRPLAGRAGATIA